MLILIHNSICCFIRVGGGINNNGIITPILIQNQHVDFRIKSRSSIKIIKSRIRISILKPNIIFKMFVLVSIIEKKTSLEPRVLDHPSRFALSLSLSFAVK
jgi:hypothetical protein